MRVFWIGVTDEYVEAKIAFLEENHVDVENFENRQLFLEALEEGGENSEQSPVVTVLYFSGLSMSLELCASIKQIVAANPPNIFLVVKNISPEERDQFYGAGGDDLLIDPVGNVELLSKILLCARRRKEKSDMENEILQSGNMAMIAMESSSDTGQILAFTRNIIADRSIKNLVTAIVGLTSISATTTLIELLTYHESLYFSDGSESQLEIKNAINKHKSESRVVLTGNTLQINQANIILQLKGVSTGDQAVLGRLSDYLSQLTEMANHFVRVINQENQVLQVEEIRKIFFRSIGGDLKPRMKITRILLANLAKISVGESFDEKHLASLKVGQENVNKAGQIVNMLIDVNNIPGSVGEGTGKSFQMAELLKKLAEKFLPVAEFNKNSIKLACSINQAVELNEKYLSNILMRILENAVIYTREGSIKILCEMVDEGSGKYIVVEISDTGPGLTKADMANLLSPEGQGKAKGKQCGMGLLYARLFTELLGGEIQINSSPGEGSTFRLAFPEKPQVIATKAGGDSLDNELF